MLNTTNTAAKYTENDIKILEHIQSTKDCLAKCSPILFAALKGGLYATGFFSACFFGYVTTASFMFPAAHAISSNFGLGLLGAGGITAGAGAILGIAGNRCSLFCSSLLKDSDQDNENNNPDLEKGEGGENTEKSGLLTMKPH